MLTDWVLIRRAAAELDRDLRGGRIVDAGLLDDGRFALRVGLRRSSALTVAIDLFGSPPLVTLEEHELATAADPGWARALGLALRGTRIGAIRARPGDRVLVIDAGTTSRFGVSDGVKLVLELIPRFGNAVLVRDGQVLAAAKQFSPAENEARSIQAGQAYAPPPLAGSPALPKLLAASVAAEAEALGIPSAERAAWLAARSAALLAELDAAAGALDPVYAYRDGGRLVAVHVVPLAQYAGLERSVAERLLPFFREARLGSVGRAAGDAQERRRSALIGALAKRRSAVEAEIAQVRARRDDATGRDRLRAAGDLLYTYGNAIPAGASAFVPPDDPGHPVALDPDLDAKANAARYFARYRKASDALPHLERRLELLTAKRDSFDELAWEAERADPAGLYEVAAALADVDGTQRAQARTGSAARRPLRIERPSGARILVGRSPRENVEVTFRLARPDDLWFHARGMPGSHVVLQAPPGAGAEDSDLALAADLAALHSRGRHAPRVEIDYTERKYVRKQRDGTPGLVWYTNARTLLGVPERAAG